MNFFPRQKIYVALATMVFMLHLVVAIVAKPSFTLTMFGDAVPCVLLILAILAARENFRVGAGILPVFWKVFAGGFAILLLSQTYWFYYDWARQHSLPSPVFGDSLFLLANVFFLSALALRPHSISAGRDLRSRRLDFTLLCLWWLLLYGYFSLPWVTVVWQLRSYNPSDYLLAFLQHLSIILALAVLVARKTATWRRFYLLLMLAFILIAGGNLLLSVGINQGWYYSGGFADTPFLVALYVFTIVAGYGRSLQLLQDRSPHREILQSVWTARLAMLGILSLPLIAIVGFFEEAVPPDVAMFRLLLVFAAMFFLGALVYWKLSLLTGELVRLVRLTRDSIENLKSVQQQVTHSEKMVALGRLASGAAHEISNPLTAILGYSELVSDVPSLTQEDKDHARLIQQQVHRAQAAVSSLRQTLRQDATPAPLLIDKNPVS